MSSRLKRLYLLFGLAAIIAAAIWWWNLGKESTDDAFIERNVVYLKPRVSGRLESVEVNDYQTVRKGQLLARIDPSPYQVAQEDARAKLTSAQAQLQSARAALAAFEADLAARITDATARVAVAQAQVEQQQRSLASVDAKLDQAQRDVRRYTTLAKRQQVSQQVLDNARTQLQTLTAERATTRAAIQVARQQVKAAQASLALVKSSSKQEAVHQAAVAQAKAGIQQARANLHQAQLNLQWTEVRAPVDGWISQVQAKTGSLVGPDSTLEILVSGKPWVTANFKETQIGKIQVGDRVDIAVDAYPDLTLHGHIQAFQPGTGARFAVLPPENATGNYVKVVQRLPVRIALDGLPPHLQLWPGMSVIPTVYLNSAGSPPANGSKSSR